MKKIYFLSAFLLLTIFAYSQNIVFADPNFKALLLVPGVNNYAYDSNGNYIIIDTNADNEIQNSEALAVYGLYIISPSVTSIGGIEYFTNLHELSLGLDNLSDLPIGNLTQLRNFAISSNILTSLASIEHLYLLDFLAISNVPATSVNLQNLSLLTRMQVYSTALNEINLCGTAVRSVWASNNVQLHSLIVKNNVVASVNLRTSQAGPPPLPSYMLENNTSINYICYDEGEYNAVVADLYPLNGITFSTSCDNSCLLSTTSFDSGMTLYPNPATDLITLENKEHKIDTVSIFNALGQLVKTAINSNGSAAMTMNIAELKTGTYFISIKTDKGKATKRLVKL